MITAQAEYKPNHSTLPSSLLDNDSGKLRYRTDPDRRLPEIVPVQLDRPFAAHLDLTGTQQRHIPGPARPAGHNDQP